MGDSWSRQVAVEVDVWLRGGGRLVAASERAARAQAGEFHRARRAEGLTAWPTPRVEWWNEFVRAAWEDLSRNDDRLVMNPIQEKALWTQIIASSRHGERLLVAPLQRIARMAMDAHALLCSYAPGTLKEKARLSWQDDAAAFSGWLSEFDRACASERLISVARLPLELLSLLEEDESAREPLLLVGFDRVQPVQAMVLDAWGEWRQAGLDETAERRNYYVAADEQSELAACVAWCVQKLSQNPNTRLMIVTQDLPARRGEMERAFLRLDGDSFGKSFEFSLGVPLGKVPLVRAARLILRWLTGPIEEHELDWLLGCGQSVKSREETYALTSFMRALRRRGMERTHWRCEEFLRQQPGVVLPEEWAKRMHAAVRRIHAVAEIPQLPMAWMELVPELLQMTGWPGERALTSEQFQALRRWQHALDMASSLGFNGRRLTWGEYLKALEGTLAETLFAPESEDAAILIAGASESAGLAADAIWFMGASEAAWPAPGSSHPLLPIGVQRDFAMPHATPQIDLDLARKMMMRVMSSAPEVCFSYARQIGGVETHASRLAMKIAGEPRPIPAELSVNTSAQPDVEIFEDYSRVAFMADHASGGSAVLSSQSQCPFKAFASARLGAEGWGRAEAGLNARQRGNLLHGVLRSVWSPDGIRSHDELQAMSGADLRMFVNSQVQAVLEREMPAGVRERMPRAYLALEEERLANVVTEWLEFERTRVKFTVAGTEVEQQAAVAGLTLKLRVDRIDRLNDGTFLVIDYKTGSVSTKAWELPRPEDVQLPLYACFALGEGKEPGGLVFANIRTGKDQFFGRMRNARETLLARGIERKSLAKDPLTPEDLEDWRGHIEKMAQDFLMGQADVDPIDRNTTCEKCELQVLCRIEERAVEDEADDSEEAAEDE